MNSTRHEPCHHGRDLLLLATLWLFGSLMVIAAILTFNGGTFTYALDDPYIHLAVAEEIIRGGYGVNPDEISSPSSSILWPFLLAPFARVPGGDLAPLALNILFGFLAAWVVHRRLRLQLQLPELAPWPGALVRVAGTLSVLVIGNALGLVFTGMEHVLQLLCSVVLVDAVAATVAGERLKWWHLASLAIAPLVRYELLALALAAAAAILWIRPGRQVVLAAGAGIAGVIAFSLFLVSHGLPALPSSVLVKSEATAATRGIGDAFRERITESLSEGRGTVVLCLTLASAVLAAYLGRRHRVFPLALALAAAGAAHLVAGTYGWFHRYEPYILAAIFFGLLVAATSIPTRQRGDLRLVALALGCALLLAFPYITTAPKIPVAANNIYEQQYQMHRFLDEFWKQPVAVNDLGLTSYRNEMQVLDLWGLASHEAATLRLSGIERDWISRLTKEDDIKLAIIYENWFPDRPDEWIRVGELGISRESITLGNPVACFFATSPESAGEIEELLRGFRRTLPRADTLWLRGEPRKVIPLLEERRQKAAGNAAQARAD